MKIINRTKYPRKMLVQLAKFACPKRLKTITVEFRYTRTSIGSGHFDYSKKLCVINVPRNIKDHKFPNMWTYQTKIPLGKRQGYLDHLQLDLEEMILHIISHEFRHALQHKSGRIHKVYGTETGKKFSERDADAYAIKIVRKWRKEQKYVIPVEKFGELIEIPYYKRGWN